jgi:hypothetical protein
MQKQKIIYIICPLNYIIKVESESEFLFNEKEIQLLQAYVPGVIISKMRRSVEFTIIYYKSKRPKVYYLKKKIIIYDDWSILLPIYFFHLIYGICHKYWIGNNYYTTHSACIGKNNFSLLVGHSGSGKTTLLLNLLKNYNLKLFSSNKTLLNFKKDNLTAIAGTKTITLRKKNDQKKWQPILNSKTEFVDRFAFMASKKYYTPKTSVPIKQIYLIKLNNYIKEFYQLDPRESLISLYPFFLDYVNSDAILFNGKSIFNGAIFGMEVKLKLLKNLSKIANKLNVNIISGPLDFISKKIVKFL